MFNPTKEKPVYSLDTHVGSEHHGGREAVTQSRRRICSGAEVGGRWGTPGTSQVGVGSFSGFTYKSLLCPVGPGHAVSHLVDR